ncbi:MAG: enolase C-terminal domain-like protein [Christensenellales bacterium]|jgi:mannonate dehydratase
MVTIRNIRAICTAPDGIPLVVVKVETSEPELYGLGCATYTQRYLTVAHAVEHYMKPLLVGKDVSRIEDIWQMSMVSPYWRNGPVLNNALSGVDMALWDIKGKMAEMPLYDLFGGKVREAAVVYRHAGAWTTTDPRYGHLRPLELLDQQIDNYLAQGVRHIRIQTGAYGGVHQLDGIKPEGAASGAYYDPRQYIRDTLSALEHVRNKYGEELELLHDVHERLEPVDAIRLAKEVEPLHLFYLEDPLAPEQVDWFRYIRNQTSTPIAMGELFNNPLEWRSLISEKLIDYIRVHISQIGGITPARKLAAQCEAFSVRTAWHGPGDVSPVGHAANIHLDLSSWNFGIQEWAGFGEGCIAVFPGSPELRNGYVYLNNKPGLGIEIDEELAAKYPCNPKLPTWTNARRPDGTLARP